MSERIGNRCTFPKIVGDDVFIIAEYDKGLMAHYASSHPPFSEQYGDHHEN